jgi:hypothetical protein
MQVGPCIPVGIQLLKAEVGPTSGPTWPFLTCWALPVQGPPGSGLRGLDAERRCWRTSGARWPASAPTSGARTRARPTSTGWSARGARPHRHCRDIRDQTSQYVTSKPGMKWVNGGTKFRTKLTVRSKRRSVWSASTSAPRRSGCRGRCRVRRRAAASFSCAPVCSKRRGSYDPTWRFVTDSKMDRFCTVSPWW